MSVLHVSFDPLCAACIWLCDTFVVGQKVHVWFTLLDNTDGYRNDIVAALVDLLLNFAIFLSIFRKYNRQRLLPKISLNQSIVVLKMFRKFMYAMRSYDSLLNSLISFVCLSLEGRILCSGGSRTS